jgi:rhodanese-related sulfurtransferase
MERFMINLLKLHTVTVFLMLFVGVAQADRVGVNDLDAVLNSGGVIIDIRSPAEVDKTGMIQGSHPLPFFDDQGYSDGANWLATLKQKVDEGQAVVLVSSQGDDSLPLCNMLKNEQGFSQVLFLDGGINAWQQAGNVLQNTPQVSTSVDEAASNETRPVNTMPINESLK